MNDYKKAYRYIRAMERGDSMPFRGKSPMEGLDLIAIANAVRSRVLSRQTDKHERRFVMRCAYAKPEVIDDKIHWIYDAESDGIPF
jgi:hypothetical protein